MGATKSGMDPATERRLAFGRAVAAALDGRQQSWLGAEISRIIGRDTPVSGSAISQWIAGLADPDREHVFAAEKALELPPGALSRHLGYLPADAVPTTGVLDALDADTKLTKKTRGIVRAAYLNAVGE